MPMFMPQMGGMMGTPMGIPGYPGYGMNPYQFGQMPMFPNGAAGTQQTPSLQQERSKPAEPQTKEEYIMRFNKEVLPRLTTKRLVKLQSVAALF